MSLTIRHQILHHLRTMAESHTWQHTPEQLHVHLARTAYDVDRHPLPILAILPQPDEVEATRYGTDRNTMPVELVALLLFDASAPAEDPYAELADLAEPAYGEIQALFTSPPAALADLVEQINYTGGGLVEYPDQQGQVVVQITVNLDVVYQTATGDPYNH